MIGTSLPEYIFIRVAIFFLQYTAPICLSYPLISATVSGDVVGVLSRTSSQVVIGYSVLDALYATFVFYPYQKRLKEEANHPPLPPPPERQALFKRCLDNIPNVSRYLQKWFLGADMADIKREDVRDFISWAFFDRWPGLGTNAENKELDQYVSQVEEQIGHELEPGTGKAKSLRLTLDEIPFSYRSVIWYTIIGGVDIYTHIQFIRRGFQYYAQPSPLSHCVVPPRPHSLFSKRRSVGKLSYYYRPHTAKDKLPVLFLHGIGIGLWTYVPYLSSLNELSSETDQIGIIALEVLPVSFRLTDAPLGRDEFLSEITAILAAHGWNRFVTIGHSYGTVLAAYLLNSALLNPRVDSVLLIDPVCLLLHLPDVAFNFTRRKPRKANEWLLWYFASMDPGVAHCLGRHFFWKECIVWKEDLVRTGQNPLSGDQTASNLSGVSATRRVAVCLGERDLIVDTPVMLQYLTGKGDWALTKGVLGDYSSDDSKERNLGLTKDHFENDGIEVLWFPGLDHAQVFDYPEACSRVASVTRRLCTRQ
ncbi:Alpha/Beta hydrolase protein [Xylariaceae sp. FL0255]|nr:Alpha/Beta hydrolase protein [Xylariaceae sp. FL0255]